MNKVENALLQSCEEDIGSNSGCGPTVSDGDLNINQRMAQLMMLLQQIDETAKGLDDVPMDELSEMVSSALGLCGFVDSNEARDALAQVLEAIERTDRSPANPGLVDRIPADPMQEARPLGSAQVRRN